MKKKVLIILTCIIATMLLASCSAKQPERNETEATETLGDVEDTQADAPNTEVTPDTPSTEVTTPDTPSTEDANVSETPAPQPSETPQPEQPQASTYTYTELNKTMYAKSSVNVRNLPSTDGEKVGSLKKGQAVKVTGQCNETKWYCINLDGKVAFVSNNYLVDNKPKEETPSTPSKPSTPENDTPSDGGLGGKIIDVGNGYTIDYTYDDDYDASLSYEHCKRLANAGIYNPVWNSSNNTYYMLIKKTDDTFYWDNWLCDYIIDRGGTPGVGGGNNSDVALNGEKLYQIYVRVEQQE